MSKQKPKPGMSSLWGLLFLFGCVSSPSPPVSQPTTAPLPSVSATPVLVPTAIPSPSPLLPAATPVVSQPTAVLSATPSATPSATAVPFQTISQLIDLRCASCHGFNGGVSLRSSEQILQALPRIRVRVVEQKNMPPGGLPESERALIARWITEGASIAP